MKADASTFDLEVEDTNLRCPVGEAYAAQQMREGSIPVLSCEGPCIRGEIARQAAHRVASQAPFARACQGEAMTIPQSGMARQMRRMLQPHQLIEIDAHSLYRKYNDLFAIDDVPEAERNAVAGEVAELVLSTLEPVVRR